MPHSVATVLVVLVLAAAWSDFRTRRIPNVLTVAGAVSGLALHVWYSGLPGALTSIEGLLVGLGLFIMFFFAGGMGAGDVKLLAAIGALLGPQSLILVFVLTGLLGGVAAAAVIVWRRNWRATMPYGPIIAAGTLVSLLCNVIEY